MDALPEFRVLKPATLDEALPARAANPGSQPLGGGTDLVVNIRRGIVAPPVLIDMNQVAELSTIKADANTLEIGTSVRLTALAEHPARSAEHTSELPPSQRVRGAAGADRHEPGGGAVHHQG